MTTFAVMPNRRALAPLEMVLALPFLLGFLALIINIGNIGCWKVRSLTVARHALWGNQSPGLWDHKTGGSDPRPAYWPGNNSGSNAADIGKTGGNVDDPRAYLPVVRGPVLMGSVGVNSDLLDPSRDLREGSASLTHALPMTRRNFRQQAKTECLDGFWRCTEMGIPNFHLRLALIYPTFQPPAANNPVITAMMAIVAAVQSGQMELLYGGDADFKKFQALYGQPAPMFINSIPGWTRLNFGCSMDSGTIQTAVDDLVERIQGSKKDTGPLRSLANALKGYYQGVKSRIQTQMQAVPPPPAGQLTQMQNDLNTLDGYIKAIDQFIKSL
jgi:hypothetical protein